jgi:hypothetical protein
VDPQTAEQLARAADALQKSGAQQAMQQAAERLEAADPSGAAPPQEAAASALDQAASSLRRLQAGMSSAGGQKLSRAAQELTRDTLFLSRQQEQLLQSTEALQPLSAQSASRGKPQREATRRRQEGLARSTRELGGRLRALAQQTPLLDPSLAGQAEQAAGVMDQAAREAAAGAGLQAAQTQREAMGELNGLAEELLRLGEQLQQAGQGAAIQQLLQQLQGLAQQQRGLNQQTQQRSGQGSTPRRQGSSGNLADQQAAIREALERLLQRAGKGSGLPDKLGGTGQEMKDVEQRLREERLGRETQQRQADILRHMLDAQRSVYRKNEERRERVSERPKPFRLPPSPPELKPRSAPQTGPRMTPGEGADLPLDFEDLVREYFRALAERP